MKLAVFGAAGRTGAEVLTQALAAGHEVTAVVRDAGRVTEPRATVVVADIHDRDQVAAAVAGVDAVISTVGPKPRQPTTVYSAGIANLAAALRGRRLLCLSTSALDQSRIPAAQRFVQNIVVQVLFRHGHADMGRLEAVLARVTDVDWTVVRVPGLTAKPATGRYRTAEAPLDRASTVSRADLAAYLLAAVTDESTYRRVMEISA